MTHQGVDFMITQLQNQENMSQQLLSDMLLALHNLCNHELFVAEFLARDGLALLISLCLPRRRRIAGELCQCFMASRPKYKNR